ncbi:MAG: LPS assembly protein LptD [Gammaproteobacteria bacterium]|nr:LPS assembly protein LptD [Gammaproteobacteria bacterium]
MKRLLSLLLLTTLLWAAGALAAEQPALCSVRPVAREPLVEVPVGQTLIDADESTTTPEGVTLLQGHVTLLREGSSLAAEELIYDPNREQAEAAGQVVLMDEAVVLEGDRLELNLATDSGALENAHYTLRTNPGRGDAIRIIRRDATHHELERASYTTCPAGRVAWRLRASRVKLDSEADRGTAHNAWLQFKGVPLFYTPWISFPLSDARQTGLLSPSFSNSEDSGLDLTVPFYWNIAPNMDATLTGRYMSERGTQLGTHYRYLTHSMRGEADLEYLPDDDVAGDDRKAFSWQESGSFKRNWSHRVDFGYVSDNQYFEDFGNSLSSASTTYLRRLAETRYSGSGWSLTGRVSGYQSLSGAEQYDRLPQFLFNYGQTHQGTGLRYGVTSEYVDFDRSTGVTGQRTELYPTLSWPLRRAGYHLIPKLGVRYTRYDLDNQTPGLESAPDRTLPIFSLDNGWVFERPLQFARLPLLQTLEPRLFYLYVPEENQDDIPLFDTSRYDFGIYQLFRENRFSGSDRVGDANQLSMALTSRLFRGDNGNELLRATFGEILYFRDREVTLQPGQAIEDDSSSEYVAELAAKLTRHWDASAGLQWDPDDSTTQKSELALRYRDGDGRILNLAYRARRADIEQTDLSFFWPLNPSWSLVGRSYYSLRDERALETFAGLEYNTCCWSLRVVGRHYVKDTEIANDESDKSIMIQLELKGLGQVGNSVGDLLEEGILGYRSDEY